MSSTTATLNTMKHNESPHFIIVFGGDDYLAEQTVRSLCDDACKQNPEAEVIDLDASTAGHYDFDEAVSPSLLSTANIVVVSNLQNADERMIDAMADFCRQKDDSAQHSVVIAQHDGSGKGRKYITLLVDAGASQQKINDLKYANDKLDFVLQQFERCGRKVDPQAAQQLVSVLGEHTGELAAMCDQLCFDFDDNPIGLDRVNQYLDSDPQVTGFAVADRALAGQAFEAITSMRSAVRQGVSPIALIGALEMKLRTLAKASALQAGTISQAEAKMPPWMLNNARRQLSGWTSAGLSMCIQALAQADETNKTNGGDPVYSLERCLNLIACKGRGL